MCQAITSSLGVSAFVLATSHIFCMNLSKNTRQTGFERVPSKTNHDHPSLVGKVSALSLISTPGWWENNSSLLNIASKSFPQKLFPRVSTELSGPWLILALPVGANMQQLHFRKSQREQKPPRHEKRSAPSVAPVARPRSREEDVCSRPGEVLARSGWRCHWGVGLFSNIWPWVKIQFVPPVNIPIPTKID